MSLVHDNDAVVIKIRFTEGFTQEDTVRHVLDDGVLERYEWGRTISKDTEEG